MGLNGNLTNFTGDPNGNGGNGNNGGTGSTGGSSRGGFPPFMGGGSSQFAPDELMTNMNKAHHTPTLFRDAVINQTMSVLIGKNKPNALLVGLAGTGKTKIVEELANRIETKHPSVPLILHDYTIWNLQLSDLVAGTGIVGELEEKVNNLVEFLSDKKNKAIVFVDEIHVLFAGETYKKIAQILKPAMSRGKIKVIGATTTQELKSIETDPAFNRRFGKVLVDELSKAQTLEILTAFKSTLFKHYNTTFNFDDDLGKYIINTADDFCSTGSHRPDNALTLLDRTVADAIIRKQEMLNSPDPTISAMAKAMPGILLSENSIKTTAWKITTGNNEPKQFDVDELRNDFSRILGQEHIIEPLIKVIRLHDMHVRPRKRPLTFLFTGPSGVGKTELTKILASSYIGEKPIILNMPEFHSSASINRIIGAPAGYVGYDANSELPFDALDTNPYQVILLDEFEKCHSSVQRLFMSVFDEGYLKTNTGKTIDFSKSIIIATTNAGCTNDAFSIGLVKNDKKDKTIEDLSAYFNIELLNRFSHRFTFHSLSRELYTDIMRNAYAADVADIKTRKPRVQLLDDIDPTELENLVEKSYNPKLGAHPIKTVITEYIDTQLLNNP